MAPIDVSFYSSLVTSVTGLMVGFVVDVLDPIASEFEKWIRDEVEKVLRILLNLFYFHLGIILVLMQ